jgi:hypothetical protein
MIMPLSGLLSLASSKNLARSVSLSFAPWIMLALPYNSLSWENSFGFRLPTTD